MAARCIPGGAHPLDDRFGVEGDFAWVIDGATDLTHDVLFAEAEGNASWLAGQLDHAFRRFAVGGITGRELLRRAIAQVSLVASLEGIGKVEDFPVAVGVIARLSPPTEVEFTLIGDCIAAIEETSGSGSEVRQVTDPAWPALPTPSTRRPTQPATGHPVAERSTPADDPRSDELQRMVTARRRYNGGGGRWVLRREPEAAEHAFVSVHVASPGDRVLLMSDGAERLLHKPGFAFPELFERSFDDPDGLITDLRDFEDEQPDRWYVRHDDVTLLALRVPS